LKDTTIPQLRQKFRLLIEYGHFRNLEAIAMALRKKPGTIKSWADGGDRWESGRIAKASYDNVIQLFADAIARHHEIDDVESAVKGRVSDLEVLFTQPPLLVLSTLIKQEAVSDLGRLIKVQKGLLDLVKTSNAPSSGADCFVAIGESFRIVFEKAGTGSNIVVLQQARQGWGFVTAELDFKTSEILVPGLNGDGSIADMSEHHWTGDNRFVAFQTNIPLPRKILVAIKEGLPPDSTLVQELVEFYAAQRFENRKLFVLSVLIKEKEVD
jgi:hypothetical protein